MMTQLLGIALLFILCCVLASILVHRWVKNLWRGSQLSALLASVLFGLIMYMRERHVGAFLLFFIFGYMCAEAFTILTGAGVLIWRRHGSERLRRLRRLEGCCVNCGYNLTGNVSGICSECGERI